jgi:hypothetical protein
VLTKKSDSRPLGLDGTAGNDLKHGNWIMILTGEIGRRRQGTGVDGGHGSRRPRPALGCSAIVDDS